MLQKRVLAPFKKVHRNPHFQTLYPYIFRKVDNNIGVKRVITNGEVPIEVFYKTPKNKTLVIQTHGMEGSASSVYIKGLNLELEKISVDTLSWNLRNCGSDFSHTSTLYHAGRTQDLKAVVDFAINDLKYENIFLVGYSLGGCITLNFLAEHNYPQIKGSSVVSSPLSLRESSVELAKIKNKHYELFFLASILNKLRILQGMYPEIKKKTPHLTKLRSLKYFDRYVTAPLGGFKDEEDYYEKNSTLYKLDLVKVNTLILNSKDDPFLGSSSTDKKLVNKHKFVKLETPSFGGHVGFMKGIGKDFTHESRIAEFIKNTISEIPELDRGVS